MKGKWQLEGLAQRARLQETCDAAAAGRVCLKDIHRSSCQHPAKIIDIIAVFSGGDVHTGGRAISKKTQAFQVIRRYWFLKPTHIEFGKVLCLGKCLLARIRSIGIHAELHELVRWPL